MDLRIYLKNVSQGTKLYSLVSGEVTFKEIRGIEIVVLDHHHCEQKYHFTGKLLNAGLDGECLLFPSKENRDWNTFCPFKKGDIIVSPSRIIAIFDHIENKSLPDTIVYQAIYYCDGIIKVKLDVGIGYARNARLATQEEKDLFFDSLTKAGYFWNGEEVVPIFKKGDIVVSAGGCIAIVDHIEKCGSYNDVVYYQCCIGSCNLFTVGIDMGIGCASDCKYASTYDQERILRELKEHGFEIKDNTVVKKNKFDFDSLTEFDKVLVRDSNKQCWCGDFFQYMEGSRFVCTSSDWTYCIPYNDDTKHFVGTSMSAPEFYRK